MREPVLLTVNPGSSTIKLGLFSFEPEPQRLGTGIIDLRHTPWTVQITSGEAKADISLTATPSDNLLGVVEETLDLLASRFSVNTLAAVGHRVVHGGALFAGPAKITEVTQDQIGTLIPLAPLHQPQSVRLIRAIRSLRPEVPQTASFDTAFHHGQSNVVQRFALPRDLFEEGVKRYGFHGLSYKFIAAQLRRLAPDTAGGRIVVAHLGSGASLCALDAGVSRETTMGFSTLDGIPMATRCGALDPGVLIYLMKERGMSIEQVEDLLYHRSGLLGLSGISADSRDLIGNVAPEARDALDVFTFRIARETAALATTLGGLDGIVFTAGIGEHQPVIREMVCRRLAWLGVEVDPSMNAQNASRIEASTSKVAVRVIPTDEEQVIADEACSIMNIRNAI